MVPTKRRRLLNWKILVFIHLFCYVVGTIIFHARISSVSSPVADAPQLVQPRIVPERRDESVPLFSREPIIQPGCTAQFVDKSMAFCHNGDSLDQTIGPSIGLRLVEYHYRCGTSALTVIDISKESRNGRTCLWVGPSEHADKSKDIIWSVAGDINLSPATPAVLVTDLFQDYYWLATPRIGKRPHNARGKRCLVDDTEDDKSQGRRLAKQASIDTVRLLSSGKDIFSFLEELRLCDSVESNAILPLVLADSLGIPNKATDQTKQQEYLEYVTSTNRTMPEWSDRMNLKHPSQEERTSIAWELARSFPYQVVTPSSASEEKPATELKTLIIIMGNIRGGDVAWSTFYKHLLDLNSADLALVIGQTPKEKRTSSLFQRAKYLYEFPEFDDWGTAVDNLNGSHWRPFILPYANDKWGTWGGVGEKSGSGAVIFMIRWYVAKFLVEKELLNQYDRFVLTRSDHYYGCDHDLSLLDNNYMWIPRGEDYKFGVTDRHLVCNRAQILEALNVYPPILRHPEKYASPQFADLNPEQLLRFRWEQENLWPWVRRFERVMFTCAADGDKTRWTEKSEHKVKEGVFLKYEFEYEETTCVCKTDPCNFPYTKRKMRVGYPQRDQKLV